MNLEGNFKGMTGFYYLLLNLKIVPKGRAYLSSLALNLTHHNQVSNGNQTHANGRKYVFGCGCI